MPNVPVVTRFAPSPTGYLHVGGARTALFNWLLARRAGGKFLLRVEDTDLARSTQQATDQLLEDMRWLGLHWDNPELIYQSKRQSVYNAVIDDLIKRGLAYKTYETKEQEDALRAEAEKAKRTYRYVRPKLTEEQARQYELEGRPHVVRFAMPVKDYVFDDQILGKINLPAGEVQDFIIRKTDGMPTYHFAVVVDDAEMGVTHVVRGQEHTLNTFLHIALQEALGYPRPVYAHIPVILNKDDGKKMGKRDRDKKIRQLASIAIKQKRITVEQLAQRVDALLGPSEDLQTARLPHDNPVDHFKDWLANDGSQLFLSEQSAVMRVLGVPESQLPEISIHDFRKNGYLPEVLLNFLALVGWSPGGDRERLSIDELIQLFTLEGVHKSAAKFDREKLLAFNTEACASAPPDRMVAAMHDYLLANPDSSLNKATDDQLATLIKMKAGLRVLRDCDESSRFLFMDDEQINYDPQAVEKVLKKQNGIAVLQDLQPRLEALSDFKHEPIEKMIEAYCAEKQLGLGKVAQPIRVAVSGGTISPPIFQSLEFLGKQHTLARIARCLSIVGAS